MFSPITVNNDITIAETFNPINPQPIPAAEPRIVSEKTINLTGFFSEQDRINLSPEAQQKSLNAQVINNTKPQETPDEPSNEFVAVSTSVGRAASSGNLRREEAVAIYQKIASLL